MSNARPTVDADLTIRRHFTAEGVHPYDEVEWETRDAVIQNYRTGDVAFEQRGVEVPKAWSQNATNIAAQKYFRGSLGTPQRERSVRQMIDRVVDRYQEEGVARGYFADAAEARVFRDELTHLLVTQKAAFNSPVWFNVGWRPKGEEQVSACQPYHALVSTPAGLVPIGRLVDDQAVGDKVYDATGVTAIVAVKANGIKHVLRLHTDAGYSLDVTADHLVFKRAGRRRGRFVRAGELRPGDALEWHRRDSYGESEIEPSAVSEAAAAGAAAGDAVPRWLLDAPLPVVASYLRALYDADGVVVFADGSWRVLLPAPEELARGIQTLLLRFGIFARLSLGGGRAAVVIDGQPHRRTFADEIGFRDETRTRTLARTFDGPGAPAAAVETVRIDRIEDLGPMDVYDIQTESGEYLSANLRVHNCFILSVEDEMRSILNWYVEEGLIFKHGSGAGVNLSTLRSSKERLRSGGTASGPVSFMRGADASAGTIKSGGATRRAAKMVVLNVSHPDVRDFIWCKALEERKARSLREAGYDMDLDGKDSHSLQYQNANNSVRVTDEFMTAVVEDRDWDLRAVTTGEVVETVKARELFRDIAQAAWECADPGLQYDTTINRWHPVPNSGRINASNPCSEYMSVDDSSCNLASLNLLKFLDDDGRFDVESFKHAVEVMFLAQEISVGFASYPTEKIAENSRKMRQLGQGVANLGALLMALGLPYDSDEGRATAAAIQAVQTGHCYATSAKIARRVGPFEEYAKNREPFLKVMNMHRDAAYGIDGQLAPRELVDEARRRWDEAVALGAQTGYRNAQAVVAAPTGTIGLLMDCDTTGIEPDLALKKHKKLVGGGTMSIVNQTVPRALRTLGYTHEQIDAIVAHIDEHGDVVGAPHLLPGHVPVFDTAMGERAIHYMGHIKMLAAIQPFLSGSASKTVNLPEQVTVADIEHAYTEGWRLGLKCLAVYRDNCKVGQPLSIAKNEGAKVAGAGAKKGPAELPQPVRRRLPKKRVSKTIKFRVADIEGYITVGEFPEGGVGEIFLKVAKQGSTLAGIMDAFAISVSMGLQYGVPLSAYVKQFVNTRFEPSGMTDDSDFRIATSILDYVFKVLALDYLSVEEREALGIRTAGERQAEIESKLDGNGNGNGHASEGVIVLGPVAEANAGSLPFCGTCGVQMQPAGSCYACTSCGTTSGCS